jgi:hypothetical protein
MSVGIHRVAADPNSAVPFFNGVNAQVVQANSSAEAVALAQASQDGDIDPVWAAATVDNLPDVPDLTNWVVRVQVNTSTATDVSVSGVAGDSLTDLLTNVASALVAANHGTDHAAFATDTLTVASAGDALGDKIVTITVTPPTGLFLTSYTWVQTDVVGTITDGGSSGSALTVAFDMTWVYPARILGYKQ